MVKRRARAAACLLAAAFGMPCAAQDGSEIERAGEHFRVVFHPGDLPAELADSLAGAALARVEQFWPLVSKLVGSRARDVHVIHLYRDEAVYRAVEKGASPWSFPLEAFVTETGIGHACLWPVLGEPGLALLGLPQPTAEGLLRIAAEQVIAPAVPDTVIRDWVKWILVMGAVELATNPAHASGADVTYDARRAVFVSVRLKGTRQTLTEFVAHDAKIRTLDDWILVTSCSAVLAQTMAAVDGKRWASKLLKKHKMPRGQHGAAALQRAGAKAVFGSKWRKAEDLFAEILDGADPNWITRRPLCQKDGERWVVAGGKRDSASLQLVDWKLPPGDFVVTGRMELGPVAQEHARIVLGWDGNTLVGVLFAAGKVSIATYDVRNPFWDSKQTIAIPLSRGVPFAFRVAVTSQEIRVEVDGEPRAAWEHGGREVHGFLACEVNNQVAWLEDLRVEPLEQQK